MPLYIQHRAKLVHQFLPAGPAQQRHAGSVGYDGYDALALPHSSRAKGRHWTNVWDYPGVNPFAGRANLENASDGEAGGAIRNFSNRRGIVLDPFGGSGSTLIAAVRTNRKARLIEIDVLHHADTMCGGGSL